MLKRKRNDSRPPAKGNNGHSHNHSYSNSNSKNVPPPTTTAKPQPEKAVGAFEASYTEVLRALKKARGFERQRIARRVTEEKKQSKQKGKAKRKKAKKVVEGGDDDESTARVERLEREVEVLKTLDYEVTARVHLANAMLKARGIAEAPGPLGAHLQLASEVLSQRTKAYRTDDIHNVTSALYNRPFVRDAVAKAVRGMCTLLGVPPPDKNQRVRKSKGEEEEDKMDFDDASDAGDLDDETRKNTQANTPKANGKTASQKADEEDSDDSDDEEDNLQYNEEDDAAIERELAKFGSRLGGDDDEDDEEEDEEENSEDEDGEETDEKDDGLGDSDDDLDDDLDDDAFIAKLRAKKAAAIAKGLWKDDDARSDYSGEESDGAEIEEGDEDEEEEFGGFSDEESEEEEDDDDEEDNSSDEEDNSSDEEDNSSDEEDNSSDEDLRPRKRKATAATNTSDGTSHFLPSLMGGYISDGGDDEDGVADDEEAAARMLGGQRKNRRGQRARQAIWEKKYKQLAKHVLEEEKKTKDGGDGKDTAKNKNGKKGKDGGWDAKRGAVDANDMPRWMRRKMGLVGRVGPVGGGGSGKPAPKPSAPAKKDNPNANAQVSGTLHPSWEAARKAKDKAQTAAFEGKKIVFD